MARALVILNTVADREKAVTWVNKAPARTRVEFKAAKRTLPQNDRMWAMLTDISVQVEWHGSKLSPDDWKLIFLDALKREARATINLDGNGFVNLTRSSDLSKDEMSDMIELMFKFGAEHNVNFMNELGA
jgi:hypothetical protein